MFHQKFKFLQFLQLLPTIANKEVIPLSLLKDFKDLLFSNLIINSSYIPKFASMKVKIDGVMKPRPVLAIRVEAVFQALHFLFIVKNHWKEFIHLILKSIDQHLPVALEISFSLWRLYQISNTLYIEIAVLPSYLSFKIQTEVALLLEVYKV